MARKSRRSKGKDDPFDDVAPELSDSHTVADSISTIGDDFELDVFDHSFDNDDHALLSHQSSAALDQAAAAAASRQARLVDALAPVSEYASEKRTVRREAQLKLLFRAISQFATGRMGQEAVLTNLDNIVQACTYGLRVGVASPAEQYAACRVMEVTGVVLGGDQDEYCDQIDKPLKRVAMVAGRATAVRGAALRALCLCNFMCMSDDVRTEALLDLCEGLAAREFRDQPVPAPLRSTALDCWVLLSTTIQEQYIAEEGETFLGRGLLLLPLLKESLESDSVDLRSAAGQCVALIHECRLNLGVDDTQAASTTERRFRRGSWDGSEWEILMEEVKQRIAELSVESGHHMSKKAKKAQRATFREFMSTIVDDEQPCEVVAFRGGTLTLRSWREVVQLSFVRHCLQGGFQIQLLTNAALHEVFSANGQMLNTLATMSQVEKRLMMSKTSEAAKTADRELARKRRVRTNIKNDFLTVDGEYL